MKEKYKYYSERIGYNFLRIVKDLMKDKKVVQKDISAILNISEKSVNKYLNGKTKLNRKFVLALCCLLETPPLVTFDIFYYAGLRISSKGDNLIYFDFIISMGKRTKKENISMFSKNFFKK